MKFSIRTGLCLASAVLSAAPVAAAPVAQPGDVGLRHDIQVLADYGAISGPVTTWPLSWDAVLTDLERIEADDVVLPNAVLPTYTRVLSTARREARRGRHAITTYVSMAENPASIRSFSNTPRENGEIGGGYSWFGEHFSVDLNASFTDESTDGQEFRGDGSQLGLDLGNWSLAASTMDRWWGPAWDGNLIVTNNARPIPALTIGRNQTTSFQSRWLKWLGPWDMSVIWGQLEDKRVIANARFFGMRANFRPLRSLEIGISRTAQWCGSGRPCGLDTFSDLFFGRDNIGDAGTTEENEPGNQLAGFDLRWTNFWFRTPISFYSQLIGEDEAGGFPSRYLAQFGIEGSGITRDQQSYRWFVEAAGTSCDIFKSTVGYNCAYRQTIYQSGYTYLGRIIGHGLDNDALVYSAGVVIVTSVGNSWQVTGRVGELNRQGDDVDHTIATVPQDMASIDIQYIWQTTLGLFDIGIGVERREIQTSGVMSRETRGFLRWSSH